MGKARQRIVFGLLFAVLGIALFVVATAYAVDHGTRRWGVIPFGVFVFPVAPVLWHVIAERRRRAKLAAAKTPSKSTLTGYDRYWMRFAVVALVVIGPMALNSHFGVLGSVYREAFWFWPKSTNLSAIGTGAQRDFKDVDKLIKRVPGEAELVVVLHQPSEGGKDGGNAVVAWGNKQGVIAADAELRDKDKPLADQIASINDAREKMKWLPFDKLGEVSSSDNALVIATDGWKSKVDPSGAGPSEELMGELRRAPQDALFVAAITPRTKMTAGDLDPATIHHGAAWLVSRDDKLLFAARLEMVDAAAATKIVGEINDVLHGKTPDIPASCRSTVDKLLENFEIAHDGVIVTARVEIPHGQLMALLFCAAK